MADPSKIMEVGMGFWSSKVLLTAVHLELFSRLAGTPRPRAWIREALGLHGRGLTDFLDALVAQGFLERDGNDPDALYRNAADTDLFLDKQKPSYMGGILEMSNSRLYPFWDRLDEALRSGKPQNESRDSDSGLFDELYKDPQRLAEFINAMAGVQQGNFAVFSKQFDFSGYRTLCDIGGAGGHLSVHVALAQPHMRCASFDLPVVTPVAEANIAAHKLQERATAVSGDFFRDDFPAADVITMGNILHDWGEEQKQQLIGKAWRALPEGGALCVLENVIDDDRRENLFGLLMSLNMLIETRDGFDMTFAQFEKWTDAAGFSRHARLPLAGPASAAIAFK